ncbi:MAG TPA: GDP-mannose 4,6-dehydratase, partial [Saprospiraceae bacterium]|nr:GDP-mannose 4,6-dehydratase [Saprospiraceae bacterium]
MLDSLFDNIYAGKKVLITGNTGFKGSWLTLWLLALQAKVYGFSIDIPTKPSLFKVLDLNSRIEHQFGDINDLAGIKLMINNIKPDFIFHLAAQPIVGTSYENPVNTFSTNIMGTVNLMEALRLSNHECTVIMVTSDKCYENQEWNWSYRENDHLGGKDPYSASKGACE